MAPLRVRDLARLSLTYSQDHAWASIAGLVPTCRRSFHYRVGPRRHFVVLVQGVRHRTRTAAGDRTAPGYVDAENGRIIRWNGCLLNDQVAPLRVRDLASLDLACSHGYARAGVAGLIPSRWHRLRDRVGARRHFVVFIGCVRHRAGGTA